RKVSRFTTTNPIKNSHTPLRGPWKVCPPPSTEQSDELHLFRLAVKQDKSWKIDVTSLSTGAISNHCSGFKGIFSMNGQVRSGKELLDGKVSG
ncbi:hypothetical protein KA005_58295, partial [bacterium]|nr:hypothetical protein [bacterium]